LEESIVEKNLDYHDFKKDKVLRALTYNPVKDLSHASKININWRVFTGRSQSSGRLGLFEFQNKRGVKNTFYVKESEEYFPYTAINEYLSSTILQMMGCISPKNKVLLDDRNGKIKEFHTGSKELENFVSFKSVSDIEMYMDKVMNDKELAQEYGLNLSKLMATVMILGDNDLNPANYFIQKPSYKIGKLDHDWSFSSRMICRTPGDLDSVPHNMFLRKLTQQQKGPMEFWSHLNFDFKYFDNSMESIFEKSAKMYLLLGFMKAAKHLINMPEPIKDHIFSLKAFENNPKFSKVFNNNEAKENIEWYLRNLKWEFERNIHSVDRLIEKPYDTLQALEKAVERRGFRKVEMESSYENTLKAIAQATQKNISLNDYKKEKKYECSNIMVKSIQDLRM
jgi:hypothetical protein